MVHVAISRKFLNLFFCCRSQFHILSFTSLSFFIFDLHSQNFQKWSKPSIINHGDSKSRHKFHFYSCLPTKKKQLNLKWFRKKMWIKKVLWSRQFFVRKEILKIMKLREDITHLNNHLWFFKLINTINCFSLPQQLSSDIFYNIVC